MSPSVVVHLLSLFVEGILQTASQGQDDSAVDDLLIGSAGDDAPDNIQQYGMDEDGPVLMLTNQLKH